MASDSNVNATSNTLQSICYKRGSLQHLHQIDDTGTNFAQLGDTDDDPTDYIDFSDEIEYDMPHEMEEHIQNDSINSMSNVIPLTPTKNIGISIEVGMEFSERKDVIDLYKAFGMGKGFGIRARQTKKNYMKLTCAREGRPAPKTNNVGEVCETKSRNTSSSRIGCKACLKASMNGDTNMWKVTYFDDNHNHGLVTPKSVPYIRSYRQMPDVARSLVEKFNDSGLPTGKVATILRGHDIMFDSRDCYNHMKNVRRKIYDAGDAQAVRSDEAFKFISDGLDALATSAKKIPTFGESTTLGDNDINSQLEESSTMNLKDPNISQTKGRKRIRSGIEEASKQTNICGHCKKRGHNKRTCKE